MNFQNTSQLLASNNPGLPGNVLQKNSSNKLIWGHVLGNSSINNMSIYQTTPGSTKTLVAPGTTSQILFRISYDNTSPLSLLSWNITHLYNHIISLGVFEITIEINISYPALSNGAYTLSLASNNADINGREYGIVFNTPNFETIETHQFTFLLDARSGPQAWVQAFINNNINSSAAISINNSAPNCKITAIKLRDS